MKAKILRLFYFNIIVMFCKLFYVKLKSIANICGGISNALINRPNKQKYIYISLNSLRLNSWKVGFQITV